MTDRGVFWATSTGLATFLETPDDIDDIWLDASSGDGSVIVGWYSTPTLGTVGARWDNGALTTLASIEGAPGSYAVNCNQDGGIIIGHNGTHSVYWSNGGNTGHLLEWPVDGAQSDVTQCSDDGTIIVGTIVTNDAVRHAVYWTNGVLTMLPNSLPDATSAFVLNCTHDGSLIAGYGFSDVYRPCYWQGGTQYPLDTGGNNDLRPQGISGDGTIIYGFVSAAVGNVNPDTSCYWDNIHTLSGGVYGTFHLLDVGVGNQTQYPPFTFATSGTVAGGRIVTGDNVNITTRWINFEPVQCQFLAGWLASSPPIGSGPANPSISGDGSILASYFIDATDTPFACFFDADGAYNALEVPDGYSRTTPFGISRDGAVIFGTATPAPPPPELKLVSLYPMDSVNGDTYALANDSGADFPSSFSQFSISVWCCEHVNIRAPNGVDEPFGLDMRLSPTQAVIQFYDASQNKLFSGTFDNPGASPNLYHVMFSVDTMAETYTMWVTGVQWTTTDAAFTNTGSINNE